MNKTIEELFERKSVRLYLDKEIDMVDKNLILKAAMEAPTAGNMQLYSIIDVTKQYIKDELSILCDNQAFIKDAKMILIFLADCTRWHKAYKEIVGDNDLKPTIADYFLGFSDALIAAQNCVVAAHSLGIGSCYIGDIVENYERVKELFELPEYALPVAMITFGYPTVEQLERKKPVRFNLEDIVYQDKYYEQSEITQVFIDKIRKGKDLSDEEALKRANTYIKSICSHKQKSEFFNEMNRSLFIMLEAFGCKK